MVPKEFGLSVHVKNPSALIIIFLDVPLPISRTAQEKTRSPVNFKIRQTPCEPRPQAKPFEGLHTAGSLRNVDKRATVNYCYQIILPL